MNLLVGALSLCLIALDTLVDATEAATTDSPTPSPTTSPTAAETEPSCIEAKISMFDQYNDGWNGNYLYIGSHNVTLVTGDFDVVTVCLEPGQYSPSCCGGFYHSEVSWSIEINGGEVSSGGADFFCNEYPAFTVFGLSEPTPAPTGSHTPTAAPSSSPTRKPTTAPTPLPTSNKCEIVEVNLFDSWGDGWNGNVLHVGSYDFELAEGFNQTYEVCMEPGDYTPTCCGGLYPAEVSWNILLDDVIVSSGGADFSCPPFPPFTITGPTDEPSSIPTLSPTNFPSSIPTVSPTTFPSSIPTTNVPSGMPSALPTIAPTTAIVTTATMGGTVNVGGSSVTDEQLRAMESAMEDTIGRGCDVTMWVADRRRLDNTHRRLSVAVSFTLSLIMEENMRLYIDDNFYEVISAEIEDAVSNGTFEVATNNILDNKSGGSLVPLSIDGVYSDPQSVEISGPLLDLRKCDGAGFIQWKTVRG